MARNTYGLDLGSYEIKVYDKKQDTIWKEKNVLAVQDKKEIIITEGYATASTIYDVTGIITVCAFNAKNLRPVAEIIRAKCPEARIIFAADNDWEKFEAKKSTS